MHGVEDHFAHVRGNPVYLFSCFARPGHRPEAVRLCLLNNYYTRHVIPVLLLQYQADLLLNPSTPLSRQPSKVSPS